MNFIQKSLYCQIFWDFPKICILLVLKSYPEPYSVVHNRLKVSKSLTIISFQENLNSIEWETHLRSDIWSTNELTMNFGAKYAIWKIIQANSYADDERSIAIITSNKHSANVTKEPHIKSL